MTNKVSAPPENPGEVLLMEQQDAYLKWQTDSGVPVIRGMYVEDLSALELAPWPRKGGRGAIVSLDGTGGVNDMHVVEIAPGGSSDPEQHLYEEMVYIVSGRGATTIWYDHGRKQSFEWGAGSLFAIPLNAWYQHFNGSGSEPVRYAAVTNLPIVLSIFHNLDFVFNNPFMFTDRFLDEKGYFSGEGLLHKNRIWETNFVPDVNTTLLYSWKERGAGGSNIFFELAHNSMGAHISQFPVGTYKKAHRHGPGAHVIILDGVGYSLLWVEGQGWKRCDWKPGSVIVPPENWFHQHFNTGAQPARYMALRYIGRRYLQPGAFRGEEGIDVSVQEGGWQIEYSGEDQAIHELFESELAKSKAACQMKAMSPWCTGVAP